MSKKIIILTMALLLSMNVMAEDPPPPPNNDSSSGTEPPPPNNEGSSGTEPPPENNDGNSGTEPPPENNEGSSGTEPPPENNEGSSGTEPPPENNEGNSGTEPPPENNEGSSGTEPPPENNDGSSGTEPPPENNDDNFEPILPENPLPLDGENPPLLDENGNPLPLDGENPPLLDENGNSLPLDGENPPLLDENGNPLPLDDENQPPLPSDENGEFISPDDLFYDDSYYDEYREEDSWEDFGLSAPEDIKHMEPEDFHKMDNSFFQMLDEENMEFIEEDDFVHFKAEYIKEMPPEAVGAMNVNQVKKLPPEEMKKLPPEEMAEMLCNFDSNEVSAEHVADFLPEDWQVYEDGRIEVPEGTNLHLKAHKHKEPPPQRVEMPNYLPDLDSHLAVGGAVQEGQQSFREEFNEVLTDFGVNFSQDDYGHLDVYGVGEYEGVDFSFAPDPDEIVQVSATESGVNTQEEDGFPRITTKNGMKMKVVPTPKDANMLLETIQGSTTQGFSKIGTKGETLVIFPRLKTKRDYDYTQVLNFDPFINPGIYPTPGLCDDSGQNCGNTRLGTRAGKEQALFVYSDGSAQTVRPTVLEPDTFITLAKQIDGVESITYRADGTFKVVFKSQSFELIPLFNPEEQQLQDGETIEAGFVFDESGNIKYTVQVGKRAITSTLTIHLIQ